MAISLSDLQQNNSNQGLVLTGKTQGDHLGSAITSVGDLNGDGIDDLVITSADAGIPNTDEYSYYDSDRRGEAYVVFGTGNGYDANFNLDNLNGSNGFRVTGKDATHQLGSAVSAGDLNGDGLDDLVLAAPQAGLNVSSYGFSYSENNGEVYVIFGTRNGFGADFSLQSLNGSNGFILKGIDAEDLLGTAVTSAGDLNGDGIDDLAVSAAGGGKQVTNSNGFTASDRRGEVYVLFGSRNGFDSRINLFSLNGSNGFIVDGKDANDSLGGALSNAGDINGDGIDDLIIGTANGGDVLDSPFADGYSDQRGEVYVLFGNRNGFRSRFNIADQVDGFKGFTISGIGVEDNLGTSVNNAGDLNNDGIDDLIIGAANASVDGEYTKEGQAYVLFGSQDGFGSQFDLNSLNGNNGFSIAGIDPADGLGNAVSTGDFDGDGIDDLFLGANSAGENISAFGFEYSDRRGEAYIIFGQQNGFNSQIDVTNLDSRQGMTITGLGEEDRLGSAISSGDINGDRLDDLIVSAPGVDLGDGDSNEGATYVIFGQPSIIVATKPTPFSDHLVGTFFNDRISGQSGNDTILGSDGHDFLDGEDSGDSLLGENGNDTLVGGNNNDFLFGGNNNDLLDGGNDQDQLQGDDGNDILIGGTDNDRLDGGNGRDTLNGTNPDNAELQFGEQDTLIGGQGEDLFILGDEERVYYDDRNPDAAGSTDYAFIEDFNPHQDQIQLRGDRNLYSLASYDDGQGNTLTNLFYLPLGSVAERIGILKNVPSDLSLDSSAFVYVETNDQPVTAATPYKDLLIGTSLDDHISGQSGDDTILGGDGDDLLDGENSGDSVYGEDGNDTLLGGNNNDFLFGGADNDLLDGGNDQDQLQGENGNDILLGGTDNDRLNGGNGDDTLNGNDPENFELQLGQQDTLTGGEGRDLFILGDQDQVYYDDRNPSTSGSTDYAFIEDFNPNQDQIQLKGDSQDYQLSFYVNDQGNTLANLFYLEPGSTRERVGILQNVSSNLSLDNSAFVYLPDQSTPQPVVDPLTEATPYNDHLQGSFFNDFLAGDNGNDTISGGDGDDVLHGENGGDSLFGDRGNDTISGGNNNDTLFGSSGNDQLNGDSNQDRLVGGSGNDLLLGGTENDLLEGGSGNDTLIGADYGNLEVQLGEQDTLIGGGGADYLILGDRDRMFYNDRDPQTSGATDYALIRGFNFDQDRIQLQGDRNSYNLSFYTDNRGIVLANLLYLEPGSTPERIGIIENVSSDLTLNNQAFVFV